MNCGPSFVKHQFINLVSFVLGIRQTGRPDLSFFFWSVCVCGGGGGLTLIFGCSRTVVSPTSFLLFPSPRHFDIFFPAFKPLHHHNHFVNLGTVMSVCVQSTRLGARPRYSLVVDEDVKKPTNQPTPCLYQTRFIRSLPTLGNLLVCPWRFVFRLRFWLPTLFIKPMMF